MKVSKHFAGSYLKAEQLPRNPVPVRISRVVVEYIGSEGQKEEKPVLYFDGKEAGLVLNKTNAIALAEMLGSDETDEWPGYMILLCRESTMFNGRSVPCIRVRPYQGTDPAPYVKPEGHLPPETPPGQMEDIPL